MKKTAFPTFGAVKESGGRGRVIENHEDVRVKYWVSVKRKENRIHIWLEDEDYVVVLADRRGFLLPWTAFLVTRNHTRRKLRKEYDAYWKTRAQKS